MKNLRLPLLALGIVALFLVNGAFAQNPLVMDQFTADPTARVFEGKIYVYPSHDIKAGSGRGRSGWFAMEDYHVFSSENLMDWTDHGVILSQTTVPWVSNSAYSMWAPDCVCKDGRYYFYFPAQNRIGVAVADKPYGPYKPEPNAIQGANGIDPCVLIDKDGTAYLYYSMNRIFVAKLKDNMLELDARAQAIANLPTRGLVEGPFTFERNGIYYLTYPHEVSGAERLEYATGESPTGPFTQKGVIMDQSPSGCWTNHHSIVEYKDQWYLFYHDQDLSPDFDKNRSIRADYLSFNEDGTIQKVIPTLRGVGIADAKSKLQIDRYSAISEEGVEVSFLNEKNTFEGWKISLDEEDAWVQFDRVDFGDSDLKSVKVRSVSSTGGSVEIRLDKADGTLLAKVEIPEGAEWKEADAKLESVPSGRHDLVVTLGAGDSVELDWVSFE
jgi:hypothetical protein